MYAEFAQMLNSLESSEEQKSKLINLKEPSSASAEHPQNNYPSKEQVNGDVVEGRIGRPKLLVEEIGANAIIEEQNEDEDEGLYSPMSMLKPNPNPAMYEDIIKQSQEQ